MLTVLVDGNALVWRAAYGMGTANNAVAIGVLNLLADVLEIVHADRLWVFWDEGKSRWRSWCFPAYKAQRLLRREKETLDVMEVFSQAHDAQRVLAHFGIGQLRVKSVEADDFMGWFSEHYYGLGDTVVLVSSDRDLWQLVRAEKDKQIIVFDPMKKQWFNTKAVHEALGVWPWQVRDLKALAGDASDSIPGAKGVGPKTAALALTAHGSVFSLFEEPALSKIKEKKTTAKILSFEDEVESAYRVVGIPTLAEAQYVLNSEEFEEIDRQVSGELLTDPNRARLLLDSYGALRFDASRAPKRDTEMTTTFFEIHQDKAIPLSEVDSQVASCSKCALRSACGEYGPTLSEGFTDAEIMIVGRNPGKNEVVEGRPFVGPSGKRLDDMLAEVGLTRRECWITNVCKCFSPGNRALEFSEICACLPYLRAEIQGLKPKLILAFGNEAQAAVSPHGASGITSRCGELLGPFTRGWIGDIESHVMLFPHPSAALRSAKSEMLFRFATQQLKLFLEKGVKRV